MSKHLPISTPQVTIKETLKSIVGTTRSEKSLRKTDIIFNNTVVFDDNYEEKITETQEESIENPDIFLREDNDILVLKGNKLTRLIIPNGSILVGNKKNRPVLLSLPSNPSNQVLTVDTNQDLGIKWSSSSGGGGGGGGGGTGNGMVSKDIFSIGIEEGTQTNYSITTEVVLFNVTDNNTSTTYTKNINFTNPEENEGRIVHIFFDSLGANLKLNFTKDKLMVGSGPSQFLTFSSSGQSASMVYLGAKWRVLNTGAIVS